MVGGSGRTSRLSDRFSFSTIEVPAFYLEDSDKTDRFVMHSITHLRGGSCKVDRWETDELVFKEQLSPYTQL
ncbi:hypothetical protein PROFUN_07275 [Planoprotostelium fungivorum]|uniref:Uncharacterized protein n=1 Tax=Planoprotostelium fungivorum TaxID=1890364 RepID=A0A2P6NM12_9EUKA|nr:hypothetical protein PROFUN_07275 [Planoprotostelium fungivorum]